MNGKVFLDSNILIYSYSHSELEKKTISQKIISENNTFISTQVIQEIANVFIRKFKYNPVDTEIVINECCQNNNLFDNNLSTILAACKISNKYQFSFYDSLIIAAAIECKCSVLYTEDMNHGQMIEAIIMVINPFV